MSVLLALRDQSTYSCFLKLKKYSCEDEIVYSSCTEDEDNADTIKRLFEDIVADIWYQKKRKSENFIVKTKCKILHTFNQF